MLSHHKKRSPSTDGVPENTRDAKNARAKKLHNHLMSAPPIPLFKYIWLAAFCSMCSMRVCDSMLPALASEFNTSSVAVAGCISGFAIAYGVMQLIYGPLADHFGKPRVIAWVSVGCVVGTGLASLAPSLYTLIFARVLTGMTAAGIIPIAMAHIGDNSTSEHRQAALAQFISATILGAMVGQLIGGLASDTVGWRWAFAFIALLFMVAAWNLRASFKVDPARAQIANTNPSIGSSVLSGLNSYRAVVSIAGMPLFLLLTFFQGGVNISAMAFVPSFVHDHFSVSLTRASLVVVGYALGGLVYARAVKWLLARWQAAQIALMGGLLQAASFVGLVFVPAWAGALVVGLIGGLGSTMLHNTLQAQATRMAPHATGTAVASFAMTLFLGQALGVSTIAWFISKHGGMHAMIGLACASAVLAACVNAQFNAQRPTVN
jgi:MFS transporter, YNFM family, putative membrane transport protein